MRIGGIYALERIAHDSPPDHPTIMDVLATFIRDHSSEQWPPAEPGRVDPPERATRPDVQAALTVIGRRNPRHDRRWSGRVDLHSAVLTRADLRSADLGSADLSGAFLTGANLFGAYLSGAGPRRRVPHRRRPHRRRPHRRGPRRRYLTGAHLSGAYLSGANLIRVRDFTDVQGGRKKKYQFRTAGWSTRIQAGLKRARELSAAVPRGVVASARKSGRGCGAVACWGLGLVVVLGLPGLAVAGMMVRAARDAEPLSDKSPFISLALGPDPVGRFLLP